jgi:uncharacterized SAM-binding protein YcdF (DUF218 family)
LTTVARKHRAASSGFGRFVGRLFVVLVALWGVLVAAVLVVGNLDSARPSDAIVVMGAAQYAGRPSPVLEARLDHAVSLYRARIARKIVFTGGRRSGDISSEAATSARYARGKGVPSSSIILEDKSRSTTEQMHAVARIAKARKMRRIVLVSDRFHMLRLLLTARRLGLDAYGSPTRSSPISLTEAAGIRYVLAESVKAPLAFLLETVEK